MRRFVFLALFVLLCSFSAYAQCTTSTLTFLNESVPAMFVGQPVNFQFEAVGGTPPYTFEVLEEFGPLPAGLHLTQKGKLIGVPREETIGTTVFIRLSDAEGCVVNQAFNLEIFP
jgi:hypothetical protein